MMNDRYYGIRLGDRGYLSCLVSRRRSSCKMSYSSDFSKLYTYKCVVCTYNSSALIGRGDVLFLVGFFYAHPPIRVSGLSHRLGFIIL